MYNIIYLNCGERYEFMTDHRSYTRNLNSCEIHHHGLRTAVSNSSCDIAGQPF